MAKMIDKRAASKADVPTTATTTITGWSDGTPQTIYRDHGLGKFPIYSFPVDGHTRKDGGVLHELHLHKYTIAGPFSGSNLDRWFLTRVRRENPDSINPECFPNECTILTVDIVAAEFLFKNDEGNLEYAWVDVSLFQKGL